MTLSPASPVGRGEDIAGARITAAHQERELEAALCRHYLAASVNGHCSRELPGDGRGNHVL